MNPSNNNGILKKSLDKDNIKILLVNSQRVLERAIVAIYEQQTDAEQDIDQTSEHNGRGFTNVDAKLGSYYAKWIIGGQHLTGKHYSRALRMMLKYAGQLLILHQEKELAQTEKEADALIAQEMNI